jgi:hypothetical protein
MRRVLLLTLAAVAALGLLSPVATAAPSQPSSRVVAARQVAATAANMTAQGWETTLASHEDGYWSGRKGWYNSANGRFYYMKMFLNIWHDPAALGWYPTLMHWCTRKYGNLEVLTHCNRSGTFHALVSPNGSSVSSVGSRPFGGTCQDTRESEPGTIRNYGSSYPWGMSYAENYQVRFVTASCAHIWLTQEYDVGSYLVNFLTEEERDHDRTGEIGWTSPSGF